MHVDVIRERVRAEPFQSFTLRLADGRAFPVPHPDFIAVSRRQVLHVAPETEAVTRIDPLMVVSLDEAPEPSEPGNPP